MPPRCRPLPLLPVLPPLPESPPMIVVRSALYILFLLITLVPWALVAVVFGLVNLPSVGLWAMAGQSMRRFLTSPGRLRAFNITMAVLILSTLWPVLQAM